MYTQEQLNNLIAEVGKEFQKELAKAEEGFKLAKSEDFPPKKEESKEKDEAKDSESKGEPEKKEMSGKPEDKGSEKQSASKEEGKEDEMPPAETKKPEGQAPMAAEGEDHGYDDEDMQHMHSMYSSMSKPELKAHHDCIRKCMDGMGLAKCETGMVKSEMEDSAKDAEGYRPNGGPKQGEGCSEKGPASSGAQALEKSEPSMEVSLLKSELEAAKAESKKTLEAVESFLKKFVEKTAPAGKAITSLDIIAKTENTEKSKPLSKSEIDAKLLSVAKNPSLQKSDREAINSYYFTKNLESVRHLLG